jgi:hypothetical protein
VDDPVLAAQFNGKLKKQYGIPKNTEVVAQYKNNPIVFSRLLKLDRALGGRILI